MNRDEIAGVLARISNAIDRHDYDAFAKEYAEDCVLESPIGGTRRGRAAVTQNERGILETFSDLRINQHTLLVEGDEAISVNTISGTDTGGFFGLPPSNKAFDLPVARVYAFRDGLVVSEPAYLRLQSSSLAARRGGRLHNRRAWTVSGDMGASPT